MKLCERHCCLGTPTRRVQEEGPGLPRSPHSKYRPAENFRLETAPGNSTALTERPLKCEWLAYLGKLLLFREAS